MNFLERQFEDPVRFDRIKRGFYVGLVAVALVELILPRMFRGDDHHFWFENLPAWGSFYGLASCMAIIVVSKFIGKVWLMRREDYYES